MAYNSYGVSFNGRRIVHPGAYDTIDAIGMTATTQGSVNIPIVIGEADAGQSGKLTYFTDKTAALNYLRGGNLATAVDLMMSPAPEGGGGASVVGVIVSNQTVASTLTSGGFKFTSKESGDGGNRIRVAMEPGTIPGTKKITVDRWDLNTAPEVIDNAGAVLKIQYVGTQEYAAVTITADGNGNAGVLTVKTGADKPTSTVLLTADLTDARYATLSQLVQFLSTFQDLQVTYASYNVSDSATSALDDAPETLIKTSNYLLAVAGDVLTQVNSRSALVTVQKDVGTFTNFVATYLTGGTRGTSPTTWQDYFDRVKKEFSDVLVVLTDSDAIHSEAAAHVALMEQQRKQRQMLFVGGALGETPEQTKRRAFRLNSSRVVLAWPGIVYKGSSTPLPPYMTAAMIAGRVCGVDASEPVTFDYFNLIGLETTLVAGDPTIDDLITSGVAVLEVAPNQGIRLVQGVTTYLGANNSLYREISVRRGADQISTKMTQTLESTFVGKKGSPIATGASSIKVVDPTSVKNKVIDVLEQAVKDGEIVSYRNIVVKFLSTIITVDYEVAPFEPVNYVLVTSHFIPASSRI